MGASQSAQAYDGPQEVAGKLGRRTPCLLAFMSPQCGLCASLRPALEQVGRDQGLSRLAASAAAALRCRQPPVSLRLPALCTALSICRLLAAGTTACKWRCSARSWIGSGRQRYAQNSSGGQRCPQVHAPASHGHTPHPSLTPSPPPGQMLAYDVDTVPCFVLLAPDGEAACGATGRSLCSVAAPSSLRLAAGFPRLACPCLPNRTSRMQDAGATGAAADGSCAASDGTACGHAAAGAAAPLRHCVGIPFDLAAL